MSARQLTDLERQMLRDRITYLDGSESPELTRKELTRAARDLGLSVTAVTTAFSESLRGPAAGGTLTWPGPKDTDIDVKRYPRVLLLSVPPLGLLHTATLAKLVSGFVILGFAGLVVWWCVVMGKYDAVFLGLGAIVGLRQLRQGFALWAMRSELSATRHGVTLRRSIGPFSRRVVLDPARLRVRMDEGRVKTRQGPRYSPFIALEQGTQIYKLLVGFTTAEKVWVFDELHRWLDINFPDRNPTS